MKRQKRRTLSRQLNVWDYAYRAIASIGTAGRMSTALVVLKGNITVNGTTPVNESATSGIEPARATAP